MRERDRHRAATLSALRPPHEHDPDDLARVDAEFEAFVRNAPLGIYRSSLDGAQLRANPALVRLNGYDSEAEMLAAVRDIGGHWYVEPTRRDDFVREMLERGQVRNFESEIYRHKTRERIWVCETAWLVRDEVGRPLLFEGTVEEVTARKEAEAQLTALAEFQTALIGFVEDSLGDSPAGGCDEGFYQTLLERAVAVVPGAQAGAILLQDDEGDFHFVAAANFDLSALKRVRLRPDELYIDLGNMGAQRITQHRDIPSVSGERRAILRRAGRTDELQSTLAIPIQLGAGAVAYLSLNNFERADAFDAHAAQLGEVFAKQVGALMRRFALERELRTQQARLERQSAFQSGLLQFMQQTLRRGLDHTLYQRLLEHAQGAIPGTEAGSILIRGANGRYGFAAALGYDLTALQRVTFEADELMDNLVSGEVSVLHDLGERSAHVVQDERAEILRTAGRMDEIRSFLSLPVVLEGQVMATLNLDAFTPDAFGPDALEMGAAFAAQVGSLMQRLALEQQLENQSAALARLANYDALTGLPNRNLLHDRLAQAFAAAQGSGDQVAVLFLDLDGFKLINDSLGHSVGDDLLKAVAERLQGCLRPGDTVARQGGDEFAFVLRRAEAAEAAYTAQAALSALTAPFSLSGRSLHVSGSIGISLYPDNGDSAEALLQHADTAMYHAKARGAGRFHFYAPSMNARVLEQLQLEHDMRRGLTRGEFGLHFQPRVDLRSGQVTSFEALARWQHPERGAVPPGVFIPIAEQSGLIGALGAQMLGQAATQAVAWQRAGLCVRVAVNLSVQQLHDPAIVGVVSRTLTETGLCAERLELEITESAAMTDVELSIETLSGLRALGVHLSIDDFGTAYSSLNYLKRLPIGNLKIDRSFVMGLEDAQDSADSAIVGAIVALGKSLGFSLIAEGVETAGQLEVLQQLGCHEAQGYLFSRPLPPEQAYAWATKAASGVGVEARGL